MQVVSGAIRARARYEPVSQWLFASSLKEAMAASHHLEPEIGRASCRERVFNWV